ncbi:Integral membrane protein [Penicillium sp. DV-2018c]|nr:Integral membrane protein [Penicillium sp. DV-2018c]
MNLLQLRDEIFRHDGGIYISHRGAQGLTVSVVFTVLATCFVAMRMFTRVKLMRRVEGNDWMVMIALANSYVFMALDVIEAVSGMGMHLEDIPPHILERQMKAFWLTIPFYNAAVLCAKASILLQYFRVFPTKRMRIICWIMITVLGVYGTWAIISAFFNCVPVAKFWDTSLKGFCLSKKGLWFSNASMHIATDIAILIIPIPALMAVDLPRRQKIALMIMFGLGGFVCITSIVRLVSLKKISDSKDPTYDNVGAAAWSAVECNTGIICACLPTLKPLIARLFPGMITTFRGSRPTYGNTINTTQRTTWNGDESTIGAPVDEPEYGAGDPERILALVPGSVVKPNRKRGSEEEEKRALTQGLTQVTSVPETQSRVRTTHNPSFSVDSALR